MEYFYDYDKTAFDMRRKQAIRIDISTNKRGTRGAMITQKIPDDEQYQRVIRKKYPSLYDDTIEKKHYFDNNKASIVDKPFPGVSLEYIGAGSQELFYLGTKTDFANDIVTLQAVIKDIDDWKPESELAKEEKETLLVKYTNVKTRWDDELKDIKDTGCPFSMNTMSPSS